VYMEYGLPPPRRIKPRRDWKMAKKQVHTMATAKKVALSSDWHNVHGNVHMPGTMCTGMCT
jgi:hypothetical protein